MSQVGSNLRFSRLHPLRPSHTDQSQGSNFCGKQNDRQKKCPVEVGDPTGTPPKKQEIQMLHMNQATVHQPGINYMSKSFAGAEMGKNP